MTAPKMVVKAVKDVLKLKARAGVTTKNGATQLVWGKIEKAGGPSKFGIGAAAVRMGCLHIIETEVTRQLHQTLTDHEYKFVLPASTPLEVIAALGKTPRWIAINEGVDAIWKFALQASPGDWLMNAVLKEKKARQTQDKARESADIARFLEMNKFACLAEALSKGT